MVIRDLIQHNFWLKFISIVIATIIWSVVKVDINSDLKFSQNAATIPMVKETVIIPLSVLTQPGDSRVFKFLPNQVQITIDADSALLRDLSMRDFKAYVDLTEIRRDEWTLQKVRLHVPHGVNVIKISPSTIRIEQVSP